MLKARFDTHADSDSGNKLAAWINDLPSQTLVLVAVADSGNRYYQNAAASLKSVGAVDPLMRGFRSSWYLIGYKGTAKSWIRQNTAASGNGPVSTSVTTDIKLF